MNSTSKENRKASRAIRYRLADNIAALRRARGLTQERLGRRMQMQKNYVSNVEQGVVNITLANLEALAEGLQCDVRDLFS
jgi:transcriptional regulator with XRE-family HTH domain